MQKVRLSEALGTFKDVWSPHVVGELNGQHVKLVKLHGEFVWHHHAAEDEMFLVVHGSFQMQFRDAAGNGRQLEINQGEFVIVPRGTEHRPCAAEECHVLLFEPAGTLNTGNVKDGHTVENPNWIVDE
jgi:mannose-6-phosphate isomerase-like protein (cupin superfamily)